MKDQNTLLKPDMNKPAFQVFPRRFDRVIKDVCVTCDNKITDNSFKDEISIKEYSISGMCQECQDGVFGAG